LNPRKINFSRNWRRDLDALAEGALRQRVFPGLELLVARGDEAVLHETWGRIEIGQDAQDLVRGTLFDLASITKPVATASAVMVLLERGVVSLEDKVKDFVAEFDSEDKHGITLRHLLTHTSGLPPLIDLIGEGLSREEAVQKLLHVPPQHPTGTAMVYGDVNFLILGEVVRRVTGQSLAEFCHQNLFHPLQMAHTAFDPLSQGWELPIAPTQYCPYRKQLLRGVVHDENAHVLGGEGGNAGLFSTATDLHRFARMMLNGGELDGVRVLSGATVAAMTRNHNPRRLAPRGLGWDLKGEGPAYMSCGELLPPGTFGHTGFTGTSIWIEPASGLTVITLSNRVHISREKNQQDMIRFRPRLHNLIAAAMGM
jgi:CubicO group peptidase (beta-lactamase class C family)